MSVQLPELSDVALRDIGTVDLATVSDSYEFRQILKAFGAWVESEVALMAGQVKLNESRLELDMRGLAEVKPDPPMLWREWLLGLEKRHIIGLVLVTAILSVTLLAAIVVVFR